MTAAKQVLAKYKAEQEKVKKQLRMLNRKLMTADTFWDIYTARHAQYSYDQYHDFSLICQGAIMALEEVIEGDSAGTSNRN